MKKTPTARNAARTLAAAAVLATGLTSASAQSFFTTPDPKYLTPSWRPASGEFSWWDILYSPYDGMNYPDMDAPNGTGSSASAAGFTPPANSAPSNPYAFWHTANPSLRQVLYPGAWLLNPGSQGNIYTPAAATGYELADTTPFTAGTVVLQWQTDGQLLDFNTVRLVAPGGIDLAPVNFISEYKGGASAFGGLISRAAAQWDLTGLGVTSYTLKFSTPVSSVSMQELLLDTAPTYVEAVASARTWNTAAGAWSVGSNWSGSTVGPIGGNIVFVSGTGATIDGGTREIGELKLSAPGSFTIGASGDGVLKVNSGITALPASPASYTISAPYEIGSFNLMEIGAGSQVTLASPITGAAGLIKFGPGTLRLTTDNTFSGLLSLSEGTLEISGTNTYSGSTSVSSGRLVLHGNAPSGSAGTLGAASSAVAVGTGGSFGEPEAAVIIDGAFTVGRNFTLLNGTDPKKLGGQDTGAGAAFTGNIALQSLASNVSLHAEDADDIVTFSGMITGGGLGKTLTKTGAGTVVFSGGNKTYQNSTIVAEGTLQVKQSMTMRNLSIGAGATVLFGESGGNFAAFGSDAFLPSESAIIPESSIVVPEPSAALLLLSGAVLLLRRRSARDDKRMKTLYHSTLSTL